MKNNTILTKTIATTLASSVMISSCYKGHDFDDCMYGSFAENPTKKGISLMNVNETNLSENFQKKALGIKEIVDLILSDKDEAMEFVSDPDTYLEVKQHDFKITLSESEKKVLLAFTDDNVIKAIKDNDFETFIKICNEKKYFIIQTIDGFDSDVRSLFKTDADYESFINTFDQGDGSEITTFSGFALTGVAIFAVLYVVAITMVEVGVAGHAVMALEVEIGGVGESSKTLANTMRISNEPVLKIWVDSNGKISDDIFYNQMIEKQISVMVSNYKNIYPEESMEKIKKVLRLQLEGHYGLRK